MTEHQYAPPQDPRDAKARAKADKAYRKASRPFYKKPLFIVLAVVAVIVIIVIATSGGDDSSSSSGSAGSSPSAAAAPSGGEEQAVEPAPADDPLSDGDWTAADIQFEGAQFGTSSLSLRLTNNSSDSLSGVFTVTVYDASGARVGNLNGFANEVEAGGTQTVDFVGTDEIQGDAATFTYEFQDDGSF